jgi:hypothetical protein
MTVVSFFRKYNVGCILNYVRFIITREISCIQDVSEIRVLILTSGRTRQIMELFSITFLRKCNTN